MFEVQLKNVLCHIPQVEEALLENKALSEEERKSLLGLVQHPQYGAIYLITYLDEVYGYIAFTFQYELSLGRIISRCISYFNQYHGIGPISWFRQMQGTLHIARMPSEILVDIKNLADCYVKVFEEEKWPKTADGSAFIMKGIRPSPPLPNGRRR